MFLNKKLIENKTKRNKIDILDFHALHNTLNPTKIEFEKIFSQFKVEYVINYVKKILEI